MSHQGPRKVGVAGEAGLFGSSRDPAPPPRVCQPGVCVPRVSAARLGFPRPPFVAFGKTLEFRVLLGVGRRNGLKDLEFKKQRRMRPPASPRDLWPVRPGSGRTRWRRGRRAARCGGDEAASPGAPGTGAVRAYPGGARKARATRYFSQGPGLYPSRGSTAQRTEKKKEDLAGKRGAGAE